MVMPIVAHNYHRAYYVHNYDELERMSEVWAILVSLLVTYAIQSEVSRDVLLCTADLVNVFSEQHIQLYADQID